MAFGQYAISPFLEYFGFCDDFIETWQYDLSKKLLAVVFACTSNISPFSIIYLINKIMFCGSGAIAAVNVLTVKGATRVQIVFTGAKITTMVIIIAIGIYNMTQGHFGTEYNDWSETTGDIGIIGISFYSGLWFVIQVT